MEKILCLLENDYTFSRMTGLNRVEYGTAGDCNSIAHCPQGRFSINLKGTQLQLSSSVVWTSQREASMEIDNIVSLIFYLYYKIFHVLLSKCYNIHNIIHNIKST